jgi:hypothetical protein
MWLLRVPPVPVPERFSTWNSKRVMGSPGRKTSRGGLLLNVNE